MKLARGEKIVRSAPRSFMNLSWFASINFAQFLVGDPEIRDPRPRGGILDAGDLLIAPRL